MNNAQDWITKSMHGDDAVHTVGKLVMMGGNRNDPKVQKIGGMTCVFGLLVPDLVPTTDAHEMWECDVIIIPRRKYRGWIEPGARVDQMLTGNFGDPELWDEKFFESP